MKNLLTLLIFCSTWCCTKNALAQNDEMDRQMKAWTAYMTPGTEHKQMAGMAGQWAASTKMWMDPSQPPMMMDSKVTNEMIMGGRYLVTRYTGQMMGMPFEGISTMGFDNTTKKYVSSWIDNLGTGLLYMEGKWRDDIKGIEFKGMGVDPVSGKEVRMRQVLIFKDERTQIMEMYDEKTGREMKTMEITLTRI